MPPAEAPGESQTAQHAGKTQSSPTCLLRSGKDGKEISGVPICFPFHVYAIEAIAVHCEENILPITRVPENLPDKDRSRQL